MQIEARRLGQADKVLGFFSQWSRASRELACRAALLAGCGLFAAAGSAQADALSTPSLSGPLASNSNPASFDAGPLGKVYVTGQVSALGMTQSNTAPAPGTGNADSLLDLSNAQVEIQTTNGPVQFYLEAGAYSLPSLGTSYLRSDKAPGQLYGALPVAYAKFVLTPAISIQAGSLPTLIGAESTFTFQNMNIERGLLWNQEPAVSRGVQVNYAKGPLTAAVSLNDGYYSGRYNWVSGLLSYALDKSNTLAFVAGGDTSHSNKSTFATPLAQNNSSIYNVIYTYSSGPFTLNPYLQYSRVDRNTAAGIERPAESLGGAVLTKYVFSPTISVAARGEYLKSQSDGCGASPACIPTNLLYGPNSGAWSLTLTPTYQKGIFFARGEVSYTRIDRLTPGLGFGSDFNARDQVRGLIETGVLF